MTPNEFLNNVMWYGSLERAFRAGVHPDVIKDGYEEFKGHVIDAHDLFNTYENSKENLYSFSQAEFSLMVIEKDKNFNLKEAFVLKPEFDSLKYRVDLLKGICDELHLALNIQMKIIQSIVKLIEEHLEDENLQNM